MDSTPPPNHDDPDVTLHREAIGRPNGHRRRAFWVAVLMVVLAVLYGLAVAANQAHGASGGNSATLELIDSNLNSSQLTTTYTERPLAEILATGAWRDNDWIIAPDNGAGLGYLDTPVTFRFSLKNPTQVPLERFLIVSAPFLDRITPVAITSEDTVRRMPAMGDTYPFHQRFYDLPQWIWPVTIPPQSETLFLFEVITTGPTMLPVSVRSADALIGSSAGAIAGKAFLYGLLMFALAFNLIMVALLRTPAIAWLTLLVASVVHSQLVIDGFGMWLLWRDWPLINSLISVSIPLSLVALCQFTRHFLALTGRQALALNLLSLSALVILITTPFQGMLPGQGTLLVVGLLTCLFSLISALRIVRKNIYARYYAAAVLAIIAGILLASLRTIGWLPVNEFTNSGFYLGTALASIILTMAVAQRLLDERRRRLGAFVKARHERELRTRLESDYARLLTTHPVTRKPNRPILEEHLGRLHQNGEAYGLCLVRLERYTEIEQTLGHKAAEQLLRIYLTRFDRFLKHHYADQLVMIQGYAVASIDTVSHAFALRVGQHQPMAESAWFAITRWLESSFNEGQYTFSWNPSLGLAYAPEHGKTSSDLLSYAGFAALNPTHTLTVYDPAIADQQYEQQMLMLDLETALTNDQIQLAYQPKVRVADGEITSYEALIRWEHPDFGRVPPDRWIPIAEQMGVIHQVTLWVLGRACQDWHILTRKHDLNLTVAVNISARDLSHPAFDKTALDILRHHEVTPGNVILEITETAVMVNTSQARAMIRALSRAGFRIALDDFGTGHSSLSTLASFELDELKIDRSFLQNITQDATRQRIFRTAVELGDALELNITVEGVETEATAQWLKQFPGLYGQGYYWGFPSHLDSNGGS
ncbi:EAL domain-containing protein [Marinobacter changyiensis]|uniref:EAL domain-containing protein n=1 Tax=Marinobacter changyiensis TaxID=2604091 RepID=UPI001264460D|nr:EAL domain-containing protein [Marinobacter changyiensis]